MSNSQKIGDLVVAAAYRSAMPTSMLSQNTNFSVLRRLVMTADGSTQEKSDGQTSRVMLIGIRSSAATDEQGCGAIMANGRNYTWPISCNCECFR